MSMVFCRGCGKEIHESAPTCPHCGAPQGTPQSVMAGVDIAASAPIPEGVKGWSWGAFLLSWIWAIGNRTWIGLLALIPYVGVIMAIVLGFKGREWAWKNRQWDSLEEFNRVQKKWSFWGVIVVVGSTVLVGIGTAVVFGVDAYERKQTQVRMEQEQAQHERLAQLEREKQEQERQAREQALQREREEQQAQARALAESQAREAAEAQQAADAAQSVPAASGGINAPVYVVGESHVLESVDHENPKLNNTTERVVQAVNDGSVTFKTTNLKSGYTRYMEYTRDLALKSTRNERGDITEFDPPLPYFKFPIRNGETWVQESVERLNGVVQKRHRIAGRIEGMDSVDTAFGPQAAVKIKIESSVQGVDGSLSRGTDTSWYVPAFKRTVRSELTSQGQDGSNFSSRTIQMKSFKF